MTRRSRSGRVVVDGGLVMAYDLHGENGYFGINNFTMRYMVQAMHEATQWDYERLLNKFTDNSGRYVNRDGCRTLCKLASIAKSKEQDPVMLPIWDNFITFLQGECNGDGGSFRVD